MNPISMLTAADIMRAGTQGHLKRYRSRQRQGPPRRSSISWMRWRASRGVIGVIDNGEIIGSISADEVISGLTRHRRREAFFMSDKPSVLRPLMTRRANWRVGFFRTHHMWHWPFWSRDRLANRQPYPDCHWMPKACPSFWCLPLPPITGALRHDARCSFLAGEPGKGIRLAHPRLSVQAIALQRRTPGRRIFRPAGAIPWSPPEGQPLHRPSGFQLFSAHAAIRFIEWRFRESLQAGRLKDLRQTS